METSCRGSPMKHDARRTHTPPASEPDDKDRGRGGDHNGTNLDEMAQMGARMMRDRRQRELWSTFAVMTLGIWLVSSPATFGYTDAAMQLNDIACGVLLVVTGLLSINLYRSWAPWATCAIGIWLLFAPLVLWACLLYTSPSPRDGLLSRMPSSA